jgi:hypothetical protein
VGFAVLAVVVAGVEVLIGFSPGSALESVLPVVSVLILGEILRFVIARFSLPDVTFPLVAGTSLLVLCAWLVFTGGSLPLIAFAMLAGGWAVYDAIRSLRTENSGVVST